jgi:hypothetical protein
MMEYIDAGHGGCGGLGSRPDDPLRTRAGVPRWTKPDSAGGRDLAHIFERLLDEASELFIDQEKSRYSGETRNLLSNEATNGYMDELMNE